MLLVIDNDKPTELRRVEGKFLGGLKEAAEERSERPFTLSAAFLCYRLRVDPIYASKYLSELVNEAVARFNEESAVDVASFASDHSDILITISDKSNA